MESQAQSQYEKMREMEILINENENEEGRGADAPLPATASSASSACVTVTPSATAITLLTESTEQTGPTQNDNTQPPGPIQSNGMHSVAFHANPQPHSQVLVRMQPTSPPPPLTQGNGQTLAGR